MKGTREITNISRGFTGDKSKVSIYGYLNSNRNTFEALSEIGFVCGAFGIMSGLSFVLLPSFFDASARLYNVGCMLIFFSAVLILNGAGSGHKIAENKKPFIKRKSLEKI